MTVRSGGERDSERRPAARTDNARSSVDGFEDIGESEPAGEPFPPSG